MELYVYSPAFELASYDPPCLASLIYLNHLEIESVILNCSSPSQSPTGVLPALKDDQTFISGVFNMINYLKTKGMSTKTNLNDFEEASAHSLAIYLDSKFTDVLSYFRYVDEENYLSSTRPELSKILPFTERYYLPNRLRESAHRLLEKYNQSVEVENERRKKAQYSNLSLAILKKSQNAKTLEPLEAKMLKIGYELLDDVSNLVKGKTFIYGKNMHFLDVIIGSHLAHLFYIKSPNQKLVHYATSKHNELFSYVDRVLIAGNLDNIERFNKGASLYELYKSLWSASKVFSLKEKKDEATAPTLEEKALAKSRAYFIIAAIFSMASYITYHGLLTSGKESDDSQEAYDIETEIAQEL